MRPIHRLARVALAAGAATIALGLGATSASAAGQLNWTMENAFSSGCSTSGLHCTWLGYMSNPAAGSGTRGSITLSDGARGTDVTTTSPRGANVFYTFGFPYTDTGSSGPVYTGGGSDSFEFEGKISFVSPLPPNGHGITMTIEDPKVTLAGNGTGELYGSGVTAEGVGNTRPYDRTEPILDLDLSDATIATAPDGTQTIGEMVPSVHEEGYFFPANYTTGAGPNRTPNTFGGFQLQLNQPDFQPGTPGPPGEKGDPGENGQNGQDGQDGENGQNGKDGATGPAGPRGEPGVAGAQGPRGKQGPRGPRGVVKGVSKKKGKRVQTIRLGRAPFGFKAKQRVRVAKLGGKVLANGWARGRSAWVKTPKGAKRLTGLYVVSPAGGGSSALISLR